MVHGPGPGLLLACQSLLQCVLSHQDPLPMALSGSHVQPELTVWSAFVVCPRVSTFQSRCPLPEGNTPFPSPDIINMDLI